MDSKKELRIAYSLALILLIVGILSYAAFSAKAPEEPIRLMFRTSTGKVLFQHKMHASVSGFALACHDCHHHPEDNDSTIKACGYCHGADGEKSRVLQNCAQCHASNEIEDVKLVNKADAFHSQCTGCHKDYGAGPVECSGCHVM